MTIPCPRVLPIIGLVLCPIATAQEPGDLFENVVDTLQRRYWDRAYRKTELPALAEKFRPAAERAESLAEECAIVDGLLSNVPASHMALYSQTTYQGMIFELTSRPRLTFGFQVKQQASRFFACKILENGPAEKAGLKRGDRIVSIEGVAPHRSARMNRSSDDAYLPDAPLHALLVDRGSDPERDHDLELVIERKRGERSAIVVKAAKYSALQAAKTSARVIERGGKRIGYVHFWYIHAGCVTLLRRLAKGPFVDVDSLVLDLRGRGGSAAEGKGIVRFFDGQSKRWRKPFVVLMDRESRSAKEMLAYEFQTRKAALIFGEKSAGALVPAMFARVGQGMVLMFPGMRLGEYSDKVELKGIEPDVPVDYPLAFTAGADPILQRALQHLGR